MNTESENSALKGLIGLIFLPLSILFRGVVVSFLWAWFIVPLGVMPIGKAHALGISALMSLLTSSDKSDDSSLLAQTIASFISYAVILGFGYLWHSLM